MLALLADSTWKVRGVIGSVVARGSMVTGQSKCGWSMERLWSSVELGFGPILEKLGKEAAGTEAGWPESTPPCPRPPMEDIGVSTCHPFLGGSRIYSQTCSVCLE